MRCQSPRVQWGPGVSSAGFGVVSVRLRFLGQRRSLLHLRLSKRWERRGQKEGGRAE